MPQRYGLLLRAVLCNHDFMVNDTDFSGANLRVSLEAVAHNFSVMRQHVVPARLAAVVKQNALGLGYSYIVPTLYAAGCRHFYVADALEGKALYESLPQEHEKITIFPLISGPVTQESVDFWKKYSIQPVLSAKKNIIDYLRVAQGPVCVRVNVGHNMVGVEIEDVLGMVSALEKVSGLTILGHLPNISDPQDTANHVFLKSFLRIKDFLPQATYSLCSSAGALLGADFALDEVRCGVGLFGSLTARNTHMALPLERKLIFPFCLNARIVGLRDVKKGESMGYGHKPVLHNTQAMILGCGYANGLPVNKARNNESLQKDVVFNVKGTLCPVVQQSVGMYLSAIDVPDFGKFSVNENVTLIETLEDAKRLYTVEGSSLSTTILRMSGAHLVFV